MGLPAWLLKLVASYLTKRTLVVRYKGKISKEKNMPGGTPAGTLLGVLIFIIQMDKLNTFPLIPSPDLITPPGLRPTVTNCKFMDDMTAATAIDLKSNLEKDDSLTKPLMYHSRTSHILPQENNPMQTQLQHIEQVINDNDMKINADKTSILLFNRSKSYDFQPAVYLDNKILDVVESTKLLGTIISTDLKWNLNVAFITAKARRK